MTPCKPSRPSWNTARARALWCLQLQNNLTTARSAEIRALADYNIALEQLAFDDGTTLERNNIDVQVR